MTLQIIFIYCLCEEFVKTLGLKEDDQSKMAEAEVITFALVAALYFHGNYSKTHLFFRSHRYFTYLLGKSRLNKRLLRIPEDIWTTILSFSHACLKPGWRIIM